MPGQQKNGKPTSSRVTFNIPADWKAWLDEAARVRGLSTGALIRQCVRTFMVQVRRDREAGGVE